MATKIEKIQKILPDTVIQEIESLANPEGLRKLVADSLASIAQAKDELEGNAEYQELKESLADISQSFKDVKKFQGAKVDLALILIKVAKGDADHDLKSELDAVLSRVKASKKAAS